MPELALDPAKRHSADLDQRHRPLPHERDARTASGKLLPVKPRYGVVSPKTSSHEPPVSPLARSCPSVPSAIQSLLICEVASSNAERSRMIPTNAYLVSETVLEERMRR